MPPARASRHQRERTPRGEEEITPERLEYLRDAFNKSREQHRGGDNHRRWLKGLCCGILRFLIQVLAGYIAYRPTQPQTPSQERAYHHRQRAFKRRKEEAENCLWWITDGGWLPRRDQNLLDPGEYELDSELGEPIVISDDEDEEDLSSHQQDIGQRQLRPWINSNTAGASSDDRAARIRSARVSLDNPLLVSRPLIDHDQLSRAGVQINPPLRHRLRCDVVVSIDWHQVLDTIRLSKYKTLRVDTSSGILYCKRSSKDLFALESLRTRKAFDWQSWFYPIPILSNFTTEFLVYCPGKQNAWTALSLLRSASVRVAKFGL